MEQLYKQRGLIIEPNLMKEKMLEWSSHVLPNLSYGSVRDAFAFIGRSLQPKNIERRALSWFSSFTLYLEANPIVFSVPSPNGIAGDAIQTYVNLPYLGAVSLDVFLFCSSAILTRVHIFWKSRRVGRQIKRDDTNRGNSANNSFGSRGPPSPPVKSTIVKGYKDKSLYKTIQECQDVKKSLRKTVDPDLARTEKKTRLALQNVRTKLKGHSSSDGYLGMSPASLQDARRFLKQTPTHQAPRKYFQ